MLTKARGRRPEAFQVTDIHPLTDFKRNTSEFRGRLKQTGRAEVLTVDGRADLVVMDVVAFNKLLEKLDQLEATDGIRRGLLDVEKGRGVSLARMDARIRKRFNFQARKK